MENTLTLSDYTHTFVRDISNGDILTPEKKLYSPQSIRLYEALWAHLRAFEEEMPDISPLNRAGRKTLESFEIFLTHRGLSANSVKAYASKLKAVLKRAFDENLCGWSGAGYSTGVTEISTQIYLSIDELRAIKKAAVKPTEKAVAENFIVQCFTGMRYDTLCKFLSNPKSYLQEEGYIDITSDKTSVASLIPIGSTVSEIIEGNGGNFQIVSEQHANRVLKKLAKDAGIDRPIVQRRTIAGKTEEVIVPKWKLVRTHTARRTMISLMRQQGISNSDITLVSGHSTERQMLRYDRSGGYSRIKRLIGNEFFNTSV